MDKLTLPRHTRIMDILTDVLDLAGIEKSILAHHAFYEPWAIKFPCDKSIGFHVVTQGELYIRAAGLKAPLLLKKGDIFLAARGWTHEVATDLKTRAKKTIMDAEPFIESRGRKPLVTFASGVYRFRETPTHVFFSEIPPHIFIRAEDVPAHDPMHSAMQLLSAELASVQIGSDAVTKSLLDIMFHYILRIWTQSEHHRAQGWSAALNDPYLWKALKVIHESPEHDWTIQKLASISGLSRASFALKFKQLIGDTPAHYVTDVRVKKAAKYFRTTQSNIEEVAARVGYRDSFVFSKAFKRIQGMAPRDYRKSLAKQP